jgi:hypothetical protein
LTPDDCAPSCRQPRVLFACPLNGEERDHDNLITYPHRREELQPRWVKSTCETHKTRLIEVK